MVFLISIPNGMKCRFRRSSQCYCLSMRHHIAGSHHRRFYGMTDGVTKIEGLSHTAFQWVALYQCFLTRILWYSISWLIKGACMAKTAGQQPEQDIIGNQCMFDNFRKPAPHFMVRKCTQKRSMYEDCPGLMKQADRILILSKSMPNLPPIELSVMWHQCCWHMDKIYSPFVCWCYKSAHIAGYTPPNKMANAFLSIFWLSSSLHRDSHVWRFFFSPDGKVMTEWVEEGCL